MQLFVWERNAACPCGSGAKYKRCCLNDIEAAEQTLRRLAGPVFGATRLTAPLRAGLAAACGLKAGPGEDEQPADPEALGAAVVTVLAAMEDATGRKALTMQADLEKELRNDRRLAAIRFKPETALAAVEQAMVGHPDRRKDEDRWSGFMTAALDRLVTESLMTETIRGFFHSLRRPGLPAETREALIWGFLLALATPHIPLGYNFLWRDLLRLSLENHEPAKDIIEEIEDWEEDEIITPLPGHTGNPAALATAQPADEGASLSRSREIVAASKASRPAPVAAETGNTR